MAHTDDAGAMWVDRAQRQTLFFTATWPKEVRKLASEFLSNPAIVYIGNSDQLAANKDVTQIVKVIDDARGEKEALLNEIIRAEGPGARVIVFCSTKRMCDQLERSLARTVLCSAIHGDKDQTERNRTLSDFKVPARRPPRPASPLLALPGSPLRRSSQGQPPARPGPRRTARATSARGPRRGTPPPPAGLLCSDAPLLLGRIRRRRRDGGPPRRGPGP